jgi:thiamine pyrophosphate-dependent acetolactate synthase large subunit-like protein
LISISTQETSMSAVVSSLSPATGSTTADDTLKQKTRDAGVVSGGHLVARALKNEGVDTIFTLCGGHIIDIGDVPFSQFAEMLGGHGEEVRDPAQIAGALLRAREAIHRTGRSAVVNIWVDPREYAPGTKNQTMYK